MSEIIELVRLSGVRSSVWPHFGFKISEDGSFKNIKQVFCSRRSIVTSGS